MNEQNIRSVCLNCGKSTDTPPVCKRCKQILHKMQTALGIPIDTVAEDKAFKQMAECVYNFKPQTVKE